MEDAGIFCGDLVVVNRSLTAEHGDIVMEGLNAEPVCKRLHIRDNTIILMSANTKYPPRYVMEGDELMI